MVRRLLFCVFAVRGLSAAFLDENGYDLASGLTQRDFLAPIEDLVLARRRLPNQGLLARDLDDRFALLPRTSPSKPGGGGQPKSGGSPKGGGSPRAATGTLAQPERFASAARSRSPETARSRSPARSSGVSDSAYTTGSGGSGSSSPRSNLPRGQTGGSGGGPASFDPFGPRLSQERGRSQGRSPGGSPGGSPRVSPEGRGRSRDPPANPGIPDAKAHVRMRGPGTIYTDMGRTRAPDGEIIHAAMSDPRAASFHAANAGSQSESTLHATGKNVKAYMEDTGADRTGVMQTFGPHGVDTKIVGAGQTKRISAHAPQGQTAAVKVKSTGMGISGVTATNGDEDMT